MKILVLNGSPKRNFSDTLVITKSFLDGMNEISKNEITKIDVIDSHIEYCRGCLSCMRNGGKCIIEDDMEGILEKILSSDLLLFSFPLYCYGMPACLKALIDRTISLSSISMKKTAERYEHVAQADFSHIRYLMICGCGFPNSQQNFEAMTMQFHLMFGNDSTIITVSEAPMFNAPEAEPVTRPFLETVRNAGHEFAENGIISQKTMKILSTPMIPEEVYADICNGNAH